MIDSFFFSRLGDVCPNTGCVTPLMREKKGKDSYCVSCRTYANDTVEEKREPVRAPVHAPVRVPTAPSSEKVSLSSRGAPEEQHKIEDFLWAEMECAKQQVSSAPSLELKTAYIKYLKEVADCLASIQKLEK